MPFAIPDALDPSSLLSTFTSVVDPGLLKIAGVVIGLNVLSALVAKFAYAFGWTSGGSAPKGVKWVKRGGEGGDHYEPQFADERRRSSRRGRHGAG